MRELKNRNSLCQIIIIFCLALLPYHLYGQKVIQMVKENGVYKISCKVNGAKMKMVFDTGASSVSLSESMANYLYENEYISRKDIIGSGKSQTADGSIHNNVVINIRDIEIDGLHLNDVRAVVISSQNAPLLLGQTAIQKLGHISLDGNRLIINDYEGDLSDEEIDQLDESVNQFFDNKQYNAAIECLLKIKESCGLTISGYSKLIKCLLFTSQTSKIRQYSEDFIKEYPNPTPSEDLSIIYSVFASSYMNVDNKQAIMYCRKCISIEEQLGLPLGYSYSKLEDCYYMMNDYYNCIFNAKKAINAFLKENNTTINIIENQGIDNSEMGMAFYTYGLALEETGDADSANYMMRLSANCNYKSGIEYCIKHNINYIKHTNKNSLFD